MRRLTLPLAIFATVLVAVALAWLALTRDRGAGAEMTTEVRVVDPFHRLELSGRMNVTLVEGGAESVAIETPARAQSRVVARVEGGTLGQVIEQKISISGAGEVRADRLMSQDAVVDVSGAGSIVVNVAKTLRATISGAGTVEYYGDPEVKQSVSGVGRVKRRQSTADAIPSPDRDRDERRARHARR